MRNSSMGGPKSEGDGAETVDPQGGGMRWNRRCWLGLWWLPLAAVSPVFAQGRLEDYQRAERFLPRNLERLVEIANVEPHWIEKKNRFWYRQMDAQGSQF